jgi:hypothetical protein
VPLSKQPKRFPICVRIHNAVSKSQQIYPPYCGVRGRGLADLDTENGANILKRLVARYLGSTDSPLANTLLARQDQEVAIAIQPISLFTWNFTERMKDSLPEPPTISICPE